jgi:ABC-type transport system substrate-binding protein
MNRAEPRRATLALRTVALAGLASLAACSNDPYPAADQDRKILYTTYSEAPKTLDPAVAYTTSAHAITGNVYDSLLEYHYLKRPYELIPGLAVAVPHARALGGDRVAYRFELRPDLLFQDDDCFELAGPGTRDRQVLAPDVAYALARIADPAVTSPVIEPFSHVLGLATFGAALGERRAADAAFAALPAHEQYARLGGIEGVRVLGPLELEIVLERAYPQILYWFAMPFSAPVAWEAVEYYDGRDGRDHFADHPVGTGPYRLVEYDKYARMVLEANPNWYGVRHPEWRAPGAVYPTEGEPGDEGTVALPAELAGRVLPLVERIEFRREKESIPAFNKFLQGYYDASGIVEESFDRVVREDHLSPEMEALGVRLEKSVVPYLIYLGFNMEDATVGHAAGERGRSLRQAMSLVVDAEEYMRLFTNGRGAAAHSPIPPGIFGYDERYRNPWRSVDLERARRLLAQAGYANGVDPATGQPLRLTFDTYDTSAQGLLRIQFFVNAWRRLGLDVRIEATNYNQFQEKVRTGAYQIFQWGWVADYPDPENFLFLLWGEMRRSKNEGPNTANFQDPRYDALFVKMKQRENDAERMRLIREMNAILERERPWIELLHWEEYALFHGWLSGVKPFGMSYPTTKYRDLDPRQRAALRAQWNEPLRWPAYLLAALGAAIVVPGILTFRRERQ